VAQVLAALVSVVPIDAMNTMGIPEDDPYAKFGEPAAWAEYRAIAAAANIAAPIAPILKWEFYKAVESDDHVLTIQTADQALWANLLLTIGCRTE
jgi:L-fucose mutarotase